MSWRDLLLVLTLLAVLALAVPAAACPSCREALAAGADEDDPLREARAYNHSIYLMLGMPYLLLGVGAGLIYRSYRAAGSNRALPTRRLADAAPDSWPGDDRPG